ncbi:MAG TPA: flagellar hook-length control protein FliK [Spongiibacteraceae bacterium]|jgi:flagellar hook-length control protein FliK
MTPTAAPSSPVLLNPVTDTAKPTGAASADPAGGGISGGFELLLGEMTQLQQLPAPVGTDDDSGAGKVPATATASGNALPPTGLILPFAALSTGSLSDESNSAESNQKKSEDADATTDAIAADEALLATAVPVIASPVVVSPAIGKSGTAANGQSSDVIASALATAAIAGGNAVLEAQKDAKSGKADNGLILGKTTASGDTAATNTAAIQTIDAAASSAQSAAKNSGESEFDTFIKHFEASASTPSTATAAVADSGRMHQSARAYVDTTANSTAVSVPVGSNGWSDAVADKVMWFSANKISSAEIHLNPPDLGPLQVRVSTQHDQTSVIFTSQHTAVRDALDQALPRLRDMMGSQGMHLDVSVGGQNTQQQQYGRNDGNNNRSAQLAGLFADDGAPVSTAITSINSGRLLRSGVDAYV